MKFCLSILILLSFLGCSKKSSPEEYIARVGNNFLTAKDIREFFKNTSDTSSLQYRLFVIKWVENELIYNEAIKDGLDKDEELKKEFEDVKKQLIIHSYLERKFYSDSISFSDTEIENYYKDNLSTFTLHEEVVRVNLISFRERKYANDFRNTVLKKSDWYQCVQEFLNKEPINIVTSQLFTQLTIYPPELWKIIQNLEINELSFPIKIGDDYYVVQLVEKYLKNSTAPIGLVKDEIKSRLMLEHRKNNYQKLIKLLKNKYTVEINLDEN